MKLNLIILSFLLCAGNLIAQIEDVDFSHGYYFKIDTIFKDNIVTDWIQITPQYEVRMFETADYEYCLLDFWFSGNDPKRDYKKLKKSQAHFKYIIDSECNGLFAFWESRILDGNRMLVHSPFDTTRNVDTLIFLSKSLIYKSRNFSTLEFNTDKYKFMGK